MEKYSKYRDPFTGIHPFLNPKRRSFRLSMLFRTLIRLPLLLFFIFPSLLPFLIKLKKPKNTQNGIYICNRTGIFDIYILKILIRNCKIIDLAKQKQYVIDRKKVNIIFVEECPSNNKCLMQFVKEVGCDFDCDGAIGMRYSDSCVRMYGSWLVFWFYFLGSDNWCRVNVVEGSNCLERATDLVRTKIGVKEYQNFLIDISGKK
ncbi:hypothetical protein COBT_000041 [Conglomerata obtusa]